LEVWNHVPLKLAWSRFVLSPNIKVRVRDYVVRIARLNGFRRREVLRVGDGAKDSQTIALWASGAGLALNTRRTLRSGVALVALRACLSTNALDALDALLAAGTLSASSTCIALWAGRARGALLARDALRTGITSITL
jgi:hypothetical protein